MDLMLVLLAVTAFPVACLVFVLWMGVLEDTIPAGVRRSVQQADPPPILAVPVRRTAVPEDPGLLESALADGATPARADATPARADATPALDAIPGQRTAPVVRLRPVAHTTPAEQEPLTGT